MKNIIKIMFCSVLIMSGLGFAMEQGKSKLIAYLQENYCVVCSKKETVDCSACLPFMSNDGCKFKCGLEIVPEQWKNVQKMHDKKKEGYTVLQDVTAAEFSFITKALLLTNNNDYAAKLGLDLEILKEEAGDVFLLFSGDSQKVVDLIDKIMLWTVDASQFQKIVPVLVYSLSSIVNSYPLELALQTLIQIMEKLIENGLDIQVIMPIAEKCALLIKDAEFNVIEFSQEKDISNNVKSALFSYLQLINPTLKIPNDQDGKPIKIYKSLKDWAKYYPAELAQRISEEKINLFGIGLTDVNDVGNVVGVAPENVEQVSLESNQLSTVPAELFNKYTKLQKTWLNHNKLSTVPVELFSTCIKLQSVWLNHNQLSTVPSKLFSICTELSMVRLDSNRLSAVPAELFNTCTKLESVSLYSNRLSTVPAELFSTCTKLESVSLDSNQLPQK